MMIVTGLLFCLTFAGETTPVCAPPDQDPLKVWATQSEEMYHRAETSRAWLSWRQSKSRELAIHRARLQPNHPESGHLLTKW